MNVIIPIDNAIFIHSITYLHIVKQLFNEATSP
jgi:hypothetical protein